MANTGHQKQKLLCLLRMLQAETDSECGLTMPQIIERLQAEGIPSERKALYRDIQALRDAGFDVRKLPTRPVQYTLVVNELEFDDVMMLIDVVQSSPFLTKRKANQLVSNLKGLVSNRERKLLDKRVHVQGRIRNQSDSVFHSVDRIHEAMLEKRKVEFLYCSYTTKLERKPRHNRRLYVVTPVKVVYSDSNYYLIAYDDADERMKTYRVDRMRITQISEQGATRNEAVATYGLGDLEFQSFGMFHGEPVSATLHVDAGMMDAIVDRLGREVDVLEATAEYAEVRVNVQKSPQFFGWIAGLNGGVTISAPASLTAEYRTWLDSLKDL